MYTVVGFRKDSFTDKGTGEIVNFAKIYALSDEEMKGLVGQACEQISIRPEKLEGLKVGARIDVVYNKYGKAQDIRLLEAK